MTQQMGQLVAESRPIIAFLRPYGFGLIGFQAVFFAASAESKV
jgi:hypothetical protein